MRRVILITGPESSGTRYLAGALAQHPDLMGPDGGVADPLDDFWERDVDFISSGQWVTRRSLPAGRNGNAAMFMDFDDLDRLHGACDELMLIITTRSPAANLASWVRKRRSVGRLYDARRQYEAAYRHVFAFLSRHPDVRFLFLPLEAMLLDGGPARDGIFRLLGLAPMRRPVAGDQTVNCKHYRNFAELLESAA